MKYSIKQQPDGTHILLRHDAPAAIQQPNNAELEFWFRIEELQIEVERLKNWIGKIGHEAWKKSPHATLETMAEVAIKHSSCACHPEWGNSQDWAALGVWPPKTMEQLDGLLHDEGGEA